MSAQELQIIEGGQNLPVVVTAEQVEQVEKLVNEAIAADYPVTPVSKPREQAVTENVTELLTKNRLLRRAVGRHGKLSIPLSSDTRHVAG